MTPHLNFLSRATRERALKVSSTAE
uniref:Uncharacterized protein n=1 Tax=Anguilla anguilla TaxID=7936 RepID=A0A0E9UBH8_ANGAN